MFCVEILVDGQWTVASTHTLQADRDLQFQRFIDDGITIETIRKSEAQ